MRSGPFRSIRTGRSARGGWCRSGRARTSASTSRTCAWRRWTRSRNSHTRRSAPWALWRYRYGNAIGPMGRSYGGMRLFDRLVQHQLAHEAYRRGAVGQHLVVVGLEVELVVQLRLHRLARVEVLLHADEIRRQLGRGQLRAHPFAGGLALLRSEEHTSELQSLMRNSYAVYCLKQKNT